MKVLVIGKNGQVGSSLLVQAQQRGIECIGLGRAELDLMDSAAIADYFERGIDVDFVINAAAYTAVDLAEKEPAIADQVNHLAVKQIAAACERLDVPLTHISTDYVFNGDCETAYAEDSATSPLGVYGKTKLLGEQAVQQLCSKHIILRVSWVFSEYGKNFVKTMLRLAQEKESLAVVADQYGSPTSANSIARVILTICDQLYAKESAALWGIYHYSDFPVTTWHQLAKSVVDSAAQLKWDVSVKSIRPITTEEFPVLAARPKNSAFNVDKIENTFGIKQASWQQEVLSVLEKL